MTRQTLTALFLYMPFFGMVLGLIAAIVFSVPALAGHAVLILSLTGAGAITLSALALSLPRRTPSHRPRKAPALSAR